MSKNGMKKSTSQNPQQDWRDVLAGKRDELIRNKSDEEKQADRLKEQQAAINRRKLNAILPELYAFLAPYKQNSGIFVNNFFRKRNFELYLQDKFEGFDFDVSGIMPCVFDDFDLSMAMVGMLRRLEEAEIAYFPITPGFIRGLKVFSDALNYAPRIESPTVLYRGCSTIERNGVNGIVSTTTDYEIAKQFSRGTLLKIHVPEGTKCLDVKSIRPKEQRRKDKENEILLPPCEYTVVSQKVVQKQGEPNNWHPTTTILEINVQPQDLLQEFLKVMENPIQEYVDKVMYGQREIYQEALRLLKNFIRASKKHL